MSQGLIVNAFCLQVQFPLGEINYRHYLGLVIRQSAALKSATQHAMPSKIGHKSGLNTSFLMPYEVQREA